MTDDRRKIILFANGELLAPENLLPQIEDQDVLIAVDGGLGHMTRLGLTPELIIGDLDSVDMQAVNQLQGQGVRVRQFPIEKDQTDLDIALGIALEMNLAPIWVVAALGDRLDQTLGNIFLLTQSSLASVDVRLVDGAREVFIVRQRAEIIGKAGQRVSLLPLNGPAIGVQTSGLKYPLVEETLYPDQTRGISNQMTGDSAWVSLRQGLLLCIHETNQLPERRGKNVE